MVKPSMLDSLINKFTPDYQTLKYRTVFLILFIVSLFIRLPFFFRDYIDRDESTFILMGQSWIDGNLPYTELWDLKPPITYLFFASVIYLFGKSFLAIRLFGALIVAVTAFYTYQISLTATTKKVSFWAAIGCVALLSMFGSLQGVMSEHICMFFFMPSLYLLIQKKSFLWYVIAGLLMGLSLMTKLNLAYVVLFLGTYIPFLHFKERSYAKGILKSVLFGLGIITVIFLTFLPYYVNGYPEVWWKSVVLASLEYAGARRYSLLGFFPITLFMGIFFFFSWKRNYLDFKNPTVQWMALAVIGIVFSFIKGGRVNGHYLIQLHPIFIVLLAIFISQITTLKKLNYRPYVFFLLLFLPSETYLEYANIVKTKMKRGTFFNGEGISVPNYIKEHQIDTKNILFLEYHIGYWSLSTKPPVKSATHPSNICRNELFPFYDNPRGTAVEELRHIMEEIKPRTVVIRKNRSIFDPQLITENTYINAQLQKHYKKPITVDLAEIYVRSD
jgi:hypothetical protein